MCNQLTKDRKTYVDIVITFLGKLPNSTIVIKRPGGGWLYFKKNKEWKIANIWGLDERIVNIEEIVDAMVDFPFTVVRGIHPNIPTPEEAEHFILSVGKNRYYAVQMLKAVRDDIRIIADNTICERKNGRWSNAGRGGSSIGIIIENCNKLKIEVLL